jgi:tRNA pseudouridine55 synthase
MQPYNFIEGEILLINKPYDWTSFDVIGKIRNYIKKSLDVKKIKVGHAGTLDPLASGLLIVCTGKYTKKIDEFQAQEKEYTATFTIGATTPSNDMEKPVDQMFDYSYVTTEMIDEAAKKFIGIIEQIPPVFSAVKIEGKRAYDYARNDQEVVIQPKIITISEIEVLEIDFPNIYLRIVCSKGTYIRALARDFGDYLKCGAYLSELCRTRIGNFYLRDALEIDELKLAIDNQINTE